MIRKNKKIISKVLLIFLFFFAVIIFLPAPKAHAAVLGMTIDPIYKVLTPKADCPTIVSAAGAGANASACFDGMGKTVAAVWYDIMAAVDSLVLAVLIWIAFMNILRIQLDSYAVKKILPTFVIAIILANFSFLISRMLLDIGNVAISIFLTGNQQNGVTGAFNNLIDEVVIGPQNASAQGITNYSGYIGLYIFKQILVMAGAVFVAILGLIFLVRNYILYFLVAISPAAYMALVLPITKKYFQQWWGQFLKWIFMPVISVFWIWLAGEFFKNAQLKNGWVLPLAFAGFCLYMAVTTPFKVGGAAVGAWKKFGDWSRERGQKAANYATSRTAQWAQLKADSTNNKYAKWTYGAIGNNAARLNPETYRRAWKARVATAGAKRDKAILKSKPYSTIAGPEAQMAALIAKEFEDRKYQDVLQTKAELDAKFTPLVNEFIAGNIKGKMKMDWQKYLDEDAAAGRVATPQQQRERVAILMGQKSSDEDKVRSGLTSVRGLGGIKGIAERSAIAQKAFQQRRQRGAVAADLSGTATSYFPSSTLGTPPAGPTPPGGPTTVTSPELTQIENTLEQISHDLSSRGEGGGGPDVDRTMAGVSKPDAGVFAAVSSQQHVIVDEIQRLSPPVAEQLRRVQVAANSQYVKLQQAESRTLQTVAETLRNGQSPDEIHQLVSQGRELMNQGDVEGAKKIALQINPSAEQSLNLTTKGSTNG